MKLITMRFTENFMNNYFQIAVLFPSVLTVFHVIDFDAKGSHCQQLGLSLYC